MHRTSARSTACGMALTALLAWFGTQPAGTVVELVSSGGVSG
jgi:hypothetical protein